MTTHTRTMSYRRPDGKQLNVKVKHEKSTEESTFTICLLNPAYPPELLAKRRKAFIQTARALKAIKKSTATGERG